ncbi:hypothetical protein KEM55_006181, partial [Ascosphaera atra]
NAGRFTIATWPKVGRRISLRKPDSQNNQNNISDRALFTNSKAFRGGLTMVFRVVHTIIFRFVFVALFLNLIFGQAQLAAALEYTSALCSLANGTFAQNSTTAPGALWLNARGFNPTLLPNLQENVGVHTLDAYDELRTVVSLALTAAKYQKLGDIIYLFSLFRLNANFGMSSVDNEAMLDALWMGAKGGKLTDSSSKAASSKTKRKENTEDYLLDLYIATSTSPRLANVYKEFKGWNQTTYATTYKEKAEQGNVHSSYEDDVGNGAPLISCSALLGLLKQGVASPRYGGPRSVCYAGCCLSWSTDAVFDWKDVSPDVHRYCLEDPSPGTTMQQINMNATAQQSDDDDDDDSDGNGKADPTRSVNCKLQSMIVNKAQFNVCMSNRAMNCL